MRITSLVLELAVLSLISPTYGLPTVVKNPRDLDSDPRSEQPDPMNELASAEAPEAITQNDIASVAPGATLDVLEVPALFNQPSSSWGSPSTEQTPDPTRPENSDTAEPTKKPKPTDVDSTGHPNSDKTDSSGQQGSAPTKQPEDIIPVDWDTPADEQINQNTWKFRDDYLKGLPDLNLIPWSNTIPATEQMQWNGIDQEIRSKEPRPVEWSNTEPIPSQIHELMDEAESRVRNEACKADRARGSPIDCLP